MLQCHQYFLEHPWDPAILLDLQIQRRLEDLMVQMNLRLLLDQLNLHFQDLLLFPVFLFGQMVPENQHLLETQENLVDPVTLRCLVILHLPEVQLNL